MRNNTDHLTPDSLQPESAHEPTNEPGNDGIDRRGFLSCMAWAGTGLLWTISGGIPAARLFAATGASAQHAASVSGFSFVQISDSHLGFNKAANQDVTATLKLAIDKINALPAPPELLLHTGDITHSSRPAEFDTAQQLLSTARAGQTFYVPGEHDIASDDGALYREQHQKFVAHQPQGSRNAEATHVRSEQQDAHHTTDYEDRHNGNRARNA